MMSTLLKIGEDGKCRVQEYKLTGFFVKLGELMRENWEIRDGLNAFINMKEAIRTRRQVLGRI